MIVPQKSQRKKVVPSAIPIVEEKKELYIKIYYSNKSIADFNHVFFQTPKEKLAKTLQIKKMTFCIKATI